jgi:hypothetical protein
MDEYLNNIEVFYLCIILTRMIYEYLNILFHAFFPFNETNGNIYLAFS